MRKLVHNLECVMSEVKYTFLTPHMERYIELINIRYNIVKLVSHVGGVRTRKLMLASLALANDF